MVKNVSLWLYTVSLCTYYAVYFSYNMAWSPYCMLMLTAVKCSSSAFLLSLQCASRQHIKTSCLHTHLYVNVLEMCNILECVCQDVKNKPYQQEISLLLGLSQHVYKHWAGLNRGKTAFQSHFNDSSLPSVDWAGILKVLGDKGTHTAVNSFSVCP